MKDVGKYGFVNNYGDVLTLLLLNLLATSKGSIVTVFLGANTQHRPQDVLENVWFTKVVNPRVRPVRQVYPLTFFSKNRTVILCLDGRISII